MFAAVNRKKLIVMMEQPPKYIQMLKKKKSQDTEQCLQYVLIDVREEQSNACMCIACVWEYIL